MNSMIIWAAIGSWIQKETPAEMRLAKKEIVRALNDLHLGDQPRPHGIWAHLYTGNQKWAYSSFGAITESKDKTARWSRVDVRVGSPEFDNGNFDAFGANNGVAINALPIEGDPVATQRALWLSLDKAYKGAAAVYNAKRASLKGQPKPTVPDLLKGEIEWHGMLNSKPESVENVDALARLLSQPIRPKNALEELNAIVSESKVIVTTLSTEGHQLQYPQNRFIMRAEAIGKANDGATIRNVRSWVYPSRSEAPDTPILRQEITSMQQWLLRLKSAPVEQDYLGPVLFEPLAAVELYRQLLPPEISANPPQLSPKSDFEDYSQPIPSSRIGRRILPKGWRVIDDVNLFPNGCGAYLFDSEGQKPQRVELIQNGVVKALLMSRIPREGHDKSTGHGRFSMGERPVPLPAVVQILPPARTNSDQLKTKGLKMSQEAGNDYLIVIKRITPLALNDDFEVAFSGDGPLSGLTRPVEAYRLYADGKEEPIRGLRFHGADRRTLRDIVGAGVQSEWVNLTDAAPGQGRDAVGDIYGLGTSWSAPATLISEMELRGKSGGEKRVLPKN